MVVTHIFFGGIGTLVETSDLQFEAFNLALAENHIDYSWDRQSYVKSLSNSGGQQRLKALRLKDGSSLSDLQLAQVHADKTRIYNQLMRNQGLKLRLGGSELFDSAKGLGVKLVWATTTKQDNIDAIFDASNGHLDKAMFVKITNDRLITKQKPDPEVYLKLLSSLNLKGSEVLVIEDSISGVSSAMHASLFTLAFPGEMTSETVFNASCQTITSLAEVISYIDKA
ncbi:MAG: beta-phosphoglucomutase-like phosphatase (HAD superfamily) [Arenicella sp.]|jgi:beta-phosphoglucomutase-like phosphatase (HAD superfamily)